MRQKSVIFNYMSQETPAPEAPQAAEPAPQQVGPTEPFSIYPLNEINQNLQYQIMYQPVYVSVEDPKMYYAGPLLAKLPETEKGFLQSLSETFSIAEKKVSQTMNPIIHKIEEKGNQASEAVSTKFNELKDKAKEKYEESKKPKTVPLEEPPKPAQNPPKAEKVAEEEKPLLEDKQ